MVEAGSIQIVGVYVYYPPQPLFGRQKRPMMQTVMAEIPANAQPGMV